MRPDLRIVVQPAGRAATVGNARLQALRIVPLTCETHGSLTCSCLERRARRAEGQIPEGYTGEEIDFTREAERLAFRNIGAAILVAGVLLIAVAAVLS